MKIENDILALLALLALPASASVTISTQFGVAFDTTGFAVPDGTLWALVADTNNDGSFTGFGLNSSMQELSALSYFTAGQTLQVGGTLGVDTVFAMGGFNGTDVGLLGVSVDSINLVYGMNGTAAGLNFAFYWFPGAIYTGGSSETIGGQYGGIHTSSNDGIFDSGMVLPPDGSVVSVGAATVDAGGTILNSNFMATGLLTPPPPGPEPSTFLLSMFSGLTLLRRRR